MSRGQWDWPSQTTRGVARRALPRGRGSIKITEDVRKYAAEQGLSEEEALDAGMAEKSKEFVEAGAEVYAKA
jgi:phosphomethylpyrimidine synthase